MKKIYNTPYVKVLYTEALCETFQATTVTDGTTPLDQFKVNEEGTPDGTGNSSWFDETSNWGGD